MSVLLVIAGPSGVGKGTVVRRLLEQEPGAWFSVSVTDRPPRPGEVDGRDYFFVRREEFERLRDEGGLLEWFEVFGDLKGTPRAPVEEHLAAGLDVVVEVDVQGALAVREAFPEAALVFIRPPSREAQRQRLLERAAREAQAAGRPPPDPSEFTARLDAAAAEESLSDRFDAVVVNDDVERCAAEVRRFLTERRGRRPRSRM